MIDFFLKVKQQEAQSLPFVIYSKPKKNKVVGFFQKNDHVYFSEDFKERGFVFAPFDGSQMILIPEKKSRKLVTELTFSKENQESEVKHLINQKSKKEFKLLVQKGIDSIEKGLLKKVVLSRQEIIDVPNFDLVSVFEKLVKTYPSAFTYCWYHPKIGLWMGATPERLLKAKKNKFQTMSLAGTQIYQGQEDVSWGNKEKDEQRLVTNYILDNLKGVISEVDVSSPYTLKAGNLMHIKTDIEGIINKKSNLKQVVSILHPTPAICGLPKLEAKYFILENEGYDRSYYTGFLGELNRKFANKEKTQSDLFVNLRCMQIKDKQAYLYVGCGITKDSVPDKEWEETVNKSLTMKKIIL